MRKLLHVSDYLKSLSGCDVKELNIQLTTEYRHLRRVNYTFNAFLSQSLKMASSKPKHIAVYC